MSEWLNKLTTWFLNLVKAIFQALLDLVHDAILWVFEGILNAIAAVLALLPVPEFLQQYSFSSLMADMHPMILFAANQMRVVEAFTIIGISVGFRLLRKLFTLGQW